MLELATEKLTAVRHHNGKGIWVLAHAWYSNAFHAYLVTAEGVTKQSVVSSVGTSHQGNRINTIGYLKASPSGRHLALALYEAGVVEVLDFDNQTGKVSHPTTLVAPEYRQAYGVEFSPDETKLYVTSGFLPRQLYQFDLSSPIPSVESIPFPPSLEAENVEALQLGSDNRIYVARLLTGSRPLGHLGVIQQPNEKGAACLYQDDALELPGFPEKGSLIGLPNFLPDLVIPVSFTHQGNCAGTSIAFPLAYPSRVQVQECPQNIFIPNVFTPNGDTHNETFQVNGIQLGKWQLVVYNRLGRQVYLSQHYQNDWNGEGLESSLYYYWLRDTSSSRSYKGWVQMLQ